MTLQCVLVGQKIFPTRDDAKLAKGSFRKDLSRTRLASLLVENIFRTSQTHSNATLPTSSSSPSALTTVSVFRGVFSSKWGGEYPGARVDGLFWSWSLWKGLTSTSGDSSSPFRSSMVLCRSKSRSWDETSFDLWALSSTDNLVMEDLQNFDKNLIFGTNIYFFKC